MIAIAPTYEGPPEVARSLGRHVITVPVTKGYYADVHKLVAEAEKAGGGLIYLCNPNNPTSAVTPKADIAWMMSNLPPNTIALIDEAYIHFAETPELESALGYVRQGKNVVVTRTFSKIYGMAGLRAGFACARPDLIARMAPFRNNVISIVTAQGVMAALAESKTLLPERKAKLVRTRGELCGWLKQKGLSYIDPQANFVMIDVGRDVREVGPAMAQRGVAVGRPFPPLDHMLRVTIGTDQEMAKFREVFWTVHNA
jgi:histidinol-phosphate/aromatic aminotransferase/cobyric acid decarboxylase-like protein